AACSGRRAPGALLPPSIEQAPPQKQLDQPIQHVFVILLENHTFDNVYASYPIPEAPVTSAGLARDGRVVPLREPTVETWSPGHNDWDSAHRDWNGGAMNGFDQPTHQPEGDASVGDPTDPSDGRDAAYVSYGV